MPHRHPRILGPSASRLRAMRHRVLDAEFRTTAWNLALAARQQSPTMHRERFARVSLWPSLHKPGLSHRLVGPTQIRAGDRPRSAPCHESQARPICN